MLSEYRLDSERLQYQVYMAEALRVLTENTQRFAGGYVINAKYYDLLYRKPKHIETKTGDEIVADFISRSGLVLR